MTVEMTLLKGLSEKPNLLKYKHLIDQKTLSYQSIMLLKDYDVYFNQYTNLSSIDWTDFKTFFFQTRHPFLPPEEKLGFTEILNTLSTLEKPEQIQTTLLSFEQQLLYQDLHKDLDRNEDIIKIQDKLNTFDEKRLLVKQQVIESSQEMDLEDALGHVDRSQGLLWRCSALKEHFAGGLIKGDFGIIAGYTDSGKTSFLSSELSYMAQQLHDDQYILWLNNEGDWRRILPRIYSATLNCTEQELVKNKEKAKQKYIDRMHGNVNRIRIMDIQGKHVKDIELLLKNNPPALLVFDMLDHLRGFEKYVSSEGSHERFGKLYQWAREISSKHCPIIATSQLNREGSNCMYPDITNMKGSGVDKQAAAVYIIMIGALNGDDTIRYLSTPKFKIGSNKSWKMAVKFDSVRSRFI